MNIANNFEEALLSFEDAGVNFMLAGGFAVNYHGYTRTTSDLDVWIKPSEENKPKIIRALKKLKFDSDQINDLDFTKQFSFKIGINPMDLDIFNHITGVSYTEAEKKHDSV